MTDEEYKKNLERQQQLNEQWVDLNRRRINLHCDSGRNMLRMMNPDKTDEELGLDQPFLDEMQIDFWQGEVVRFGNFINKIKHLFFK